MRYIGVIFYNTHMHHCVTKEMLGIGAVTNLLTLTGQQAHKPMTR